MTLTLIVAGLISLVVLAWFVAPKQTYTPDPDDPLDDGKSAPIDRAALERAEREVQGWGVSATPDYEDPKDDWGPGTKQSD